MPPRCDVNGMRQVSVVIDRNLHRQHHFPPSSIAPLQHLNLIQDSGGKVTSVMLEDPQVFQEHLAQSRRVADSNRLQRPSREENVSGASWN